MRNKILIASISILFLFLFAVFFKGLNNSNIYTPIFQKNINLPEFVAKDFFSDEAIKSKDLFLNNQFYLINIWASWCLPCKVEHEFLLKFKDESEIKLIGINYKDKKKNATKFLRELKNPFDKIIVDNDGTISINLGAYGVPETFLIKNNKIIKKIIGPINNKNYLEILKKINEKN